jgi:hypothetical protein
MEIINVSIESYGVSISTPSLTIKKYDLNTNAVYIERIVATEESQIITKTNTTIRQTTPPSVSIIS